MEQNSQYVTFQVGREEYATAILKIKEIIRLKGIHITEIPNTPKYVIGIINLRGEVIPIIDLRIRFSLEHKDLNPDNRILITNIDGKIIGLLVDRVSSVMEIPQDIITLPPEEISDIHNSYISGVARQKDKIIIILDIERIIKDKEFIGA